MFLRAAKIANRVGKRKKQEQEHQVLKESFQMSQMNNLSKASAVHLWIEDHKSQGQECKEHLETDCYHGSHAAPYSSYQSGTDHRLREGDKCGKWFGQSGHETKMKEVHIFLHYKSGTDRIQ